MQLSFFFFNDPPITDIYTLSLHDALPIYCRVIQAERMGEGDCAINLHAVAHPEAPHGAGKVAKAIGREQERVFEGRNEKRARQMSLVVLDAMKIRANLFGIGIESRSQRFRDTREFRENFEALARERRHAQSIKKFCAHSG